MIWQPKEKNEPRGDDRLKRVLAAGLAAVLLGASGLVMAQTLYRWTDAEGKTHYGDRPPKNAIGLTKVDTGPETNALSVPLIPAPKAAPAAGDAPQKAAAADVATQRRETRERLEADLKRARENLDLAKKMLAEGADMMEDERQAVQQQAGRPPVTATARQNCRQVTGKDGKPALMCPASVPNEKYYERIAQLEEAVRKAEEAVAAAQTAYRRGVD
jgi:hypothetical protein